MKAFYAQREMTSMRREPTPTQLTEATIRRAMHTLKTRPDIPDEARARGINALAAALNRLHPSYSKIHRSPIRDA